MYFSTQGSRLLNRYILDAVRKGRLKAGFECIESRLGCEYVKKLHKTILDEASCPCGIRDEIERMSQDRELMLGELTELISAYRMGFKIQKVLILLLNMLLYYSLQNGISLTLFVIVNTIGVIFTIVLDHEGVVEYGKCHAGFLARGKYKRKALGPATSIKACFQLVAGAGFIVNISMLASQFLEQAA